MSSPDRTINTTILLKKPLLVIKKGLIFKPNQPIFLNTSLKRPITNATAISIDTSAKKICLTGLGGVQSSGTSIIRKARIERLPTSSTHNATMGLTAVTNTMKNNILHNNNNHVSGFVPLINDQKRICFKHGNLPEHRAEGLPKVGCTFKSPAEFKEYAAQNAHKWYFHYTCINSYNVKTSPRYNEKKKSTVKFICKFHYKYYKSRSKGIRKRSNPVGISCPAGITLKAAVGKDYRVHDVCHHHSHELSAEIFGQISHGYRLPQEIKNEIRDLAQFNVDAMYAKRYIESIIPGLNLRNNVYNTFVKLKGKPFKNTMSPERFKEMIAKVKYIKENFAHPGTRKNNGVIEKKSNGKVRKKTHKVSKNEQKTVKDLDSQNSVYETKHREGALHEAMNNNENEVAGQDYQEIPTEDPTRKSATISPHTYYINMQSAEPVDESNAAAAFLLGLNSEKDFETSQVFTPLSSITHPDQESIMDQKQEIEVLNVPKSSLVTFKRQIDTTEIRCQRRHDKLPEYKAEGLIKVGDTFSSIEEFSRYAADHALKWFFYYQINDSRNVKTDNNRYNSKKKTWYNFSCRFYKGRYKNQSTGARNVKQKTIQCPATVSMICKPSEAEFKVTYACHHHSHELSPEIFSLEVHGHRLLSEMKEEIRELLWYQVDTRLIRKYLLDKTGFDLKRTIINILSKMRKDQTKLIIPPEREIKILRKIQVIKQKFSIPKRASPRNKHKSQEEEEKYSESDDEEGNSSRVEARLNNILYDEALVRSVKELQETTGCEIQIDTWKKTNYGEGFSHLQRGLIADIDNDHDYNNTQYIMDENVDYITQANDPPLFGGQSTSQNSGKNHVYLHQTESNLQGNENNSYTKETIVPGVMDVYCKKKIIEECENNALSDEDISSTEITETKQHDEDNKNEDECQAIYEYVSDEDDGENNAESIDTQRNNEHDYIPKDNDNDVEVQVDFEILQLEREFENMNQLETSMMKTIFHSEELQQKRFTASTRGRPKVILEEGIINRYNIEFYLNVGGVISCMETLALNMNMSILDLLRKLYQGEAVFKMSMGRSGKDARKTVLLKYVPLTLTFQFEQFKCINILQEYKTICSKYCDMAIKLENAVETISADLNATNKRLDIMVSQNEELSKVKTSYEGVVVSHAVTEQLLKQSQLDLAKAQAENKVLFQKITNLEALQQIYKNKDAEILEQLSELMLDCQSLNKSGKEQTTHDSLKLKGTPMFINLPEPKSECQQNTNKSKTGSFVMIKQLQDETLTNINIIKKIKTLQETVKVSDAGIRRCKKFITKNEKKSKNLSDSQTLLARNKVLIYELGSLKKSNRIKKSGKSLQTSISDSESECDKPRMHIQSPQEDESSGNKKFIEEIRRLCICINSLKRQLKEEKQKNSELVSGQKMQ